jgi:hypothetical protein
MQNSTMPSQNPFVQRADVYKANAYYCATNVVQIGPWGTNSVNITTPHVPLRDDGYRSAPGAFYGAPASPGMPGFFGYPQAQSAFYPYPHSSHQFGSGVNWLEQDWANRGHDPFNQFSKGYPYGMQQKGFNGANYYDGSSGYTFKTRNISG